jgi:hypothetical protein
MGMKDFNQVYRQVAETLTNTAFTDGEAAFEAIERETNTGLPRSKTMYVFVCGSVVTEVFVWLTVDIFL